MTFRSELRQARGAVKGVTDPATIPGGIIAEVGVDPTLVYRRIYGAFLVANATWNFRLRYVALYQNAEVFAVEGDVMSSALETLPTTPSLLSARGWLGFSIESQPAALGYYSAIPAPADSLRVSLSLSDLGEQVCHIATASPYKCVGRWDKIRLQIVPVSGGAALSATSSLTYSDFWAACHSQSIPG